MSSFDPFQAPETDNPFAGGWGDTFGFGTWDSGNKGDNTLGHKILQTVGRDPLSRWAINNTPGWLQDPGAAFVKWMGGPQQAAPMPAAPNMVPVKGTPGAANPAGNFAGNLRAQVMRKGKGGGTQQMGMQNGPNYGTGNQVPFEVGYPT